MRYVRLSYDIDGKTPLYPGSPPISLRRLKALRRGDSCNTFSIVMQNHSGTHVDAPRHFFAHGTPISGYSIDELIFRDIAVVRCPKKPGEPITVDDLERESWGPRNADLMLLRTGFSRYRSVSPGKYRYKNPYLSSAAALWIKKHYPKLRCIGIDCVSIASFAARPEGRLTHAILLSGGKSRGKPVLIVEDLHIPRTADALDEVIVVPLFLRGVDSAPCTVIGITHD